MTGAWGAKIARLSLGGKITKSIKIRETAKQSRHETLQQSGDFYLAIKINLASHDPNAAI